MADNSSPRLGVRLETAGKRARLMMMDHTIRYQCSKVYLTLSHYCIAYRVRASVSAAAAWYRSIEDSISYCYEIREKNDVDNLEVNVLALASPPSRRQLSRPPSPVLYLPILLFPFIFAPSTSEALPHFLLISRSRYIMTRYMGVNCRPESRQSSPLIPRSWSCRTFDVIGAKKYIKVRAR